MADVRQAVLLAAGPAQRLLPLTENRPKGMLLVGGKPLLQNAVEALKGHGVEDIVIVIGRHGEKIQSFFKDGSDFGVKVHYVHQAEPSGTLDALRLALPELDITRPLWILPGHAHVTTELLRPLANAGETTLLVATAGDDHTQGVPVVRGNKLAGMHHEAPTVGSTRVTTNILVAHPGLLATISKDGLQGHKDLDLGVGDWAAKGNSVSVVGSQDPWHVVVGPWDVLALNEWVLSKMESAAGARKPKGARGAVQVGATSEIAATAILIGPVTIGEGCTIGEFSVVGPFVSVRNGTVIGSHCEVRRSILNNNVLFDSGGVIRGGILDDGVQVGARFVCEETLLPSGPHGCIVGRDSRLAARTTLPGGTILPVESRPGS